MAMKGEAGQTHDPEPLSEETGSCGKSPLRVSLDPSKVFLAFARLPSALPANQTVTLKAGLASQLPSQKCLSPPGQTRANLRGGTWMWAFLVRGTPPGQPWGLLGLMGRC